MADRQRLFVDMDGTLAVFTPVDELETLYEKGYFGNLEPHENVVSAVREIIENHPEIEVHVLSAYLTDSKYALQEKNEWLDKYLPEIDQAHRVFVPCGSDKKEGIEGGVRPDDFLLDDYTHNLNDWQPPARGIKLLNAINHTRGSWEHDRIRFDRDPSALADGIVAIMQGRERIFDERINVPMEQRERDFIENLARLEYMRGESVIFPAYEPLSVATNPTAREVYQAERERLQRGNDANRLVVLTSEMVGRREFPHDIAYNRVLTDAELASYRENQSDFLQRMYDDLGNRGAQPSNYYGNNPSVGDAFVVMTPDGAENHYVANFGFEQEADINRVITAEQQRAAGMGFTVREELAMIESIDEYARAFGNEEFADIVETETMGRLDFLHDEYTPVFNLAAVREVEEREQDKLAVIHAAEDVPFPEREPLVGGVYEGRYTISRDAVRAAMPDSRLANGRYVYDDTRVIAGERLQAEIDRRFERAAREFAQNTMNPSFYRFEASPTPLGGGRYDAFVQQYERTDVGTAIPRDIVYVGEAKKAAEVAQFLNAGETSEYGRLLTRAVDEWRKNGALPIYGMDADRDSLENYFYRQEYSRVFREVMNENREDMIRSLQGDLASGDIAMNHVTFHADDEVERSEIPVIEAEQGRAGDGIRIDGHVGTWHIVDQTQRALPHRDGEMDAFYLLEHDTYGEDAAMLIVNKEAKVVLDDVYNGFDDLDEAIADFEYSLQELESVGYTVVQVTDRMGCEIEDNDNFVRGFSDYNDFSEQETALLGTAVDRVSRAMEAAGYTANENFSVAKPSYNYEGQTVPLQFENFRENMEWLDGVVFDDPAISNAVERIMHPSRFDDVTVQAASRANYAGMVVLSQFDRDGSGEIADKVYLGKAENYNGRGVYDNSDNSLVHISDNPKMFSFLDASEGWTASQQEMIDNGAFTEADYAEFARLKEGVLSQFEEITPKKFEIDITGDSSRAVPFRYPDWTTHREEIDLSAIKDVLDGDSSYRYQFLDRLRSDCDYYLGYGNRNEQNLWAKNEKDQIAYMKAIWGSFSENEKPEWISYEDILGYENKMTGVGVEQMAEHNSQDKESVLAERIVDFWERYDPAFGYADGVEGQENKEQWIETIKPRVQDQSLYIDMLELSKDNSEARAEAGEIIGLYADMMGYQPLQNRYYEPDLDLDGTADELFTQARNGYIESPEALAKVQEILSNPVENKTEQAFYVGVLREIAENEGNDNQVFAQMKKDILDDVQPEEVTLRDGLTLEVRKEQDNVLIALMENSAEREATGASAVSVEQFLSMSAQEISVMVNEVYAYNMIEAERDEEIERPFNPQEKGGEDVRYSENEAIVRLAERIDNIAYQIDPYEYRDTVGVTLEERSEARASLANLIESRDADEIQGVITELVDYRDGLLNDPTSANEVRELNDLIYSLEHLDQYEQYYNRETPANAEFAIQEFRGDRVGGRMVEGNQIPMIMSQTPNFSDRSIVSRAVMAFEDNNNLPDNERVFHDGMAEDKEFVYGGYDKYLGMSHQNDLSLQPYMERINELAVGRQYQYASPLLMVAEVYYAQQNGLTPEQIDYALDYVKDDKYPSDTFRNVRHGLQDGLSVEQLDVLKGEREMNQEFLLEYMQGGGSVEDARALKGMTEVGQYYTVGHALKDGEINRDMAKCLIQTVNEMSNENRKDFEAQRANGEDAKYRFYSMDLEFFSEYLTDAVIADKSITVENIEAIGKEFMAQKDVDSLKAFIEQNGGFAAFPHREEVIQEKSEEVVMPKEEEKEIKEGVSIPEEKKDPKEKLTEQLQQGIKEVLNSDNFKSWLDTSSKMFLNNYSFNNAMLVWMQRPDASHTMGYEQWKDYGRNVAQGAQGIKIFVPVIAYEKKDGDLWRMIKSNLTAQLKADPSLEQASYKVGMSKLEITMNRNDLFGLRVGGVEQGIRSEKDMANFIKHNVIGKVPMYFTVGTVFDAKDTIVPEYLWVKKGYKKEELVKGEDGKPIKNRKGEYKIVNTPERQARFNPHLDMSVPEKDPAKMAILYDALKAVSERNGIHVYEKERENDDTLKGGADGYYSRAFSSENPKGFIVMPTDLDPTRAVSVMIHEMAHSELHGNLKDLAEKMGEDNVPSHMREVQAESVAYIVGKNFGIESDTSSFQYLAAWSKGFELQALSKSMEVIYGECKQLTNELKSELAVRGLNMDLSERENAPMDKEAVQAIGKSYAAYVVEQDNRIADIEKELPTIAEQNAGKSNVLSLVVQQGMNVERQKEDIAVIKDALTKLDSADTLNAQQEAVATIEAAKARIEGAKSDFSNLSEQMHTLMQNEQGLKDQFLNDPLATLEAMKQNYPQLEQLTGAQMQYLAKSEYVNRDLAPLLRNDPQQFVDKACERASQIDKVASKNGMFVEVAFCEQWTDKPIVSGGALMHPKVADTIIKQAETQIRGLKAQAEAVGDYFPYSKCALTVYQANNGKIETAFKTRVDIGDGEQASLTDHLKQISSAKGIVQDFEKATREKGAKEKILFNENPTHGEEAVQEAPVKEAPLSDRAMSKEEWAQEISNAKEADKSNGSDNRQDNTQSVNRNSNNERDK